jgi:hypothetical protein
MISLNFTLINPFSDKWKTVYCKHFMLSKNKNLEINFYKNSNIVKFSLDFFPIGRDHTPIEIGFGLFSYEIEFSFYDKRHWDDDNNKYEEYEQTS